MEQPKKQKNPPTPAEIRRIVEVAVKKVVCAELKPVKANLDYLMKKDQDALAVADYLDKHPKRRHQSDMSNQQWLNRELLKALIYALAIIAALVGAKLWQ
jgi:hypothetical protein